MNDEEKKPEQYGWVYLGAKVSPQMKVRIQQEAKKRHVLPSNLIRKIIREWIQAQDV